MKYHWTIIAAAALLLNACGRSPQPYANHNMSSESTQEHEEGATRSRYQSPSPSGSSTSKRSPELEVPALEQPTPKQVGTGVYEYSSEDSSEAPPAWRTNRNYYWLWYVNHGNSGPFSSAPVDNSSPSVQTWQRLDLPETK